MKLILGDSLQKLRDLPSGTVDCVVTDPPYGLAFMNKRWDYDVPSVDLWREVFRVLKPGAHLLSFGGTRTYHRMVQNIEDAGFEVRDMLSWLYGSGFPKSLDVSKAIDKAAGAEREVTAWVSTPWKGDGQGIPMRANNPLDDDGYVKKPITAPATDDAKRWQGYGTALKPAQEPIVLARKPLEKGLTVAENVLKWGTGALAIDACRIASQEKLTRPGVNGYNANSKYANQNREGSGCEKNGQYAERGSTNGRWPANVLLGHSDECQFLGHEDFKRKGGGPAPRTKRVGTQGTGALYTFEGNDTVKPSYETENGERIEKWACADDCAIKIMDEQSGNNASRFFYVAKASKSERNRGLEGMPEVEVQISGQGAACPKFTKDGRPNHSIKNQNHHPTVKPITLMEYLVQLVCPPGGIVLDPFLGSGTTLCAAARLKRLGIGIEMSEEYLEIAKRRIAYWSEQVDEREEPDDGQLPLPEVPA
jgi:site-specific DNA-methyltransferase (adenine-specific)